MQSKIIAFDLDDVLCYRTSEEGDVEKYFSCKPMTKMIDIVNKCYDKGHKIIIYTARGATSFNSNIPDIYSNLFMITSEQLKTWNVKYHQLVFGKIHYDVLIDDKAVNSLEINDVESVEKWLK
jgi:hydroxymethylpyrimidine pyrophosphatase-like HAD family hydrolase